jgi:hypothetical protein
MPTPTWPGSRGADRRRRRHVSHDPGRRRAWALHHAKRDGRRQGQVRANVQLDVGTWVPQVVSVSGDDGESEAAAFAKDLLSGVLYVVDRNFVDFARSSPPCWPRATTWCCAARPTSPPRR